MQFSARPLIIRNEQAERKWRWKNELARFRTPGERMTRNPVLHGIWATTIPNGIHIFPDDLTIKATGSHEIYPKLATFGKYANKYQIHINWGGKMEIIINESEYAIQSLRKYYP